MMTSLSICVRRGRRDFRQWLGRSRVQAAGAVAGSFVSGLILSAGALAGQAMPLGVGLVMGLGGVRSLAAALGSAAGFHLFWAEAGLQGMVWAGLALILSVILSRKQVGLPLLAALGAFLVSAAGLGFQVWMGDATSIPIYLLRVALGAGSAALFRLVREDRLSWAKWAAQAVVVLSLAPLGMGFAAAGILASAGAFPAAVMAGLALDFAGVSRTPMTAVLCICAAVGLIPRAPRWMKFALPGPIFLLVMGLCGANEPVTALTFSIGALAGAAMPVREEVIPRSDDVGAVRTRLEQMAGGLDQMRQMLLEIQMPPIDESALIARVRERACGGCPSRKTCRQRLDPMPTSLLHMPLFENAALPIPCKKPGRLVLELRRAQEQLRSLRADRDRQGEYRQAVEDQFLYLSNFLQQTADSLPLRPGAARFRPEAAACSAGKEAANGDRCLWFSGTQDRYYLLLCDGMGTGMGAAQEGKAAGNLLRDMLSAGFPPSYALRSLNSLLVLRGRAGAVTVDLAEIELDTGRASIYKWGAAPSYIIREGRAEKIGTASPPPGLSMTEGRETVERLSLRRGEVLVLLSDGVDGEAALAGAEQLEAMSPGELAAWALESGCRGAEDDATAAVIRLTPANLAQVYQIPPSNAVETQDVG